MVAARGARRLYRSADAANARLEGVVSGNGGCRLSKYLLDWQRAVEVCFYSFRRPHLQNELREDAEAASGFRGRRDSGDHSDSCSGGCAPIRRDCSGPGLADCRIRGKTRRTQAVAAPAWELQRFDGDLHFQYATYDSHTSSVFRGSQISARLRERYSAAHYFEAPGLRLQLRG